MCTIKNGLQRDVTNDPDTTFDKATGQFTYGTSDMSLGGRTLQFHVECTSTESKRPDHIRRVKGTFAVNMHAQEAPDQGSCADNDIMLLSEIEDTVYVLDGGEVQLTPQFSTTAPSCPVTCGLYESDGRGAFLAYRRRRSAVPDILFNGKTGSISLWTEDRDLARKTVQFQVKCTASSNVPFGTFTDDFSVTFVEPGCNSEITSSAALSIEKRWGEGPGATSFEEYTFSTECDGDYSLRYRAKARQIINGIPQPYLADLPPEIAFDEASRTFAACKCNANCASGSPADDAECTSLAFTKQWEIKIIAELGDDNNIIAKNRTG